MKKIKLVIHEPLINKVIGIELNLRLDNNANLFDVIEEVDKMINRKENFPVPNYQSLLHMIYNPLENRFYKQVAVTAYKGSGQMLNVRDGLKNELPDGVTVILIPAGGCISDWEEVIDQVKFLKVIQGKNRSKTAKS